MENRDLNWRPAFVPLRKRDIAGKSNELEQRCRQHDLQFAFGLPGAEAKRFAWE